MNKSQFEQADYYKLKFIDVIDVSLDGSKIAYVIKYFKPEKNGDFHHKEITNIWLLENGEERQLTYGDSDNAPSWSPDGKSLVFSSKRGEVSQLYLLSFSGGEAKQLTDFKQGVTEKVHWSSDGNELLFSASPPISPEEFKKNKKLPYKIEREFWHLDGLGLVNDIIHDIYSYNIANEKLTQLTSDMNHNTAPRWSSNGDKILYICSMAVNLIDGFLGGLRIIENGQIKRILPEMYVNTAEWFGESIVFIGQERTNGLTLKQNVYVYDFTTLENRLNDFKLGIGGYEIGIPVTYTGLQKILVDSNSAFVNIQNGVRSMIYAISLTGDENYKEIIAGDRLNFVQNKFENNIVFLSTSPSNPTDIHQYNTKSNEEKQLTHVNDKFLETKSLAPFELLHFKGNDGIDVQGWFLKPNIGAAPYPTLLDIHGGPHAAWGLGFVLDALILSGQGYAVCLINHRGSTGYGNDFSTAIIGDWGNLDYGDLMSGIDFVIEKGLTDPDRLGCFGVSGGGNLSCWIVGNTDRFKAAIPQNPVTNFQSFYGTSDIGRFFSKLELGGLPHEVPEIYKKVSPITYAHNCKTPTLLIHHDEDRRCPPEQSEQFYAVLKDAGCIVEMLRMPASSHGGGTLGPMVVREAQDLALIDWFSKYIPI